MLSGFELGARLPGELPPLVRVLTVGVLLVPDSERDVGFDAAPLLRVLTTLAAGGAVCATPVAAVAPLVRVRAAGAPE